MIFAGELWFFYSFSNRLLYCSGYIGADCSLESSAIPSIVSVIDPVDCDIRTRLCQSVKLKVTGVAASSSLVARVRVTYFGQVEILSC